MSELLQLAPLPGGLWGLALIVLLVAVEGPAPFLPSEPLLFAAAAAAIDSGDTVRLGAQMSAAVVGSLIGDGVLYALGRSSRGWGPAASGSAWTSTLDSLRRRPMAVLVCARLVPGGRLASVVAAGRVGVSLPGIARASLASASVWSIYIFGIGMLLAPITGGHTLPSIAAGALLGCLSAWVGSQVSRRRSRGIAKRM